MLKLSHVCVRYGKIEAVSDVSIDVEAGEIVTLIGANGAGKSTIFRAICGLKPIAAGGVMFAGERLDGRRPEQINRLGIAYVPEGRRVFSQMTVRENLELGGYLRRDKAAVRRDLDYAFSRFPRLRERQRQDAGTLSGGEQQMLAIGRALMSDPSLVLMDEPSLGLAPIMCGEIAGIIRDIHGDGRTILLVEQNARLALSLANRAYVLESGRVALHGAAKDLRGNDEIRRTYLGVRTSDPEHRETG